MVTASTLLVAVAVLGLGIWSLVEDDGLPRDRERPERPRFSFDVRAVRGLGPAGHAGKRDLRQPARQIRATLDALYNAGFVDPDQWQGGRFPEALAVFAGPAATRARRDLADLTLGPAAAEIDSVRPDPGELKLRFLIDGGRPLAAVAQTSFEATAALRDGGRLDISHQGLYLLRRSGHRWVIVGYDVDGRLAPAAKKRAGDGRGGR